MGGGEGGGGEHHEVKKEGKVTFLADVVRRAVAHIIGWKVAVKAVKK